ncbi:MAG TPA: DUF1015 family protein [Solirubrobacteraceae bacterium]|jgi:uncharacterized protein (DUF1015 family)|nr:DUF1015 family protein [Solirubrobacteraceae bacterium]
MADVEPLRALHYNLDRTGGLQDVVAPPYDVIDAEQRAKLEARSPYNVVRIDLPVGTDPYGNAARLLAAWRDEGVVVQDERPALWAIEQDYTGPDGQIRRRTGFLARVRVEDYGPGRIRPHERTHPGPKEDRLNLTRATKANLSPIFSLYDDPTGTATGVLANATTTAAPWGEATDDDGTVNRVWRIDDAKAITAIHDALANSELLIADGHHRYETARVYAEEIGGEGPHRYVLMCLVALEDPGLTVFPTHRLLKDLRPDQHEALANAIRRDFELKRLESTDELVPDYGQPVSMGYIDAHFRQPWMLTLKDQATADAALSDHAEPYRRLDTAVLEALILKGALGMTDDDIDHLTGLGYARDFDDALRLVQDGDYDAAFFVAATPIEQVRAVAAAGESMPPKSTYFFPKVPTGLLFNPLSE